MGHIWANIPPPPFSSAESEEDQHLWKHHASGVFTVASTWEKLRDRKAINHLHGLLWYKGHLPRQSFILWLATQNRLHTLDRLARMGITIDKNCKLCNSEEETHCHLFFQCIYSKSVLDTVLAQGQLQWPQMQWSQLLLWASTAFEGNGTANNHIAKTILVVTVYYLWIECNERTFKRVHRSPQVLGNVIIQLIRAHLMNTEIEDLVNDRIRATWNL
ncbi:RETROTRANSPOSON UNCLASSIFIED-LIKE PROTEIN [Salix viminalis]|uniref:RETROTRANSPOSON UNCLASSIFIED-LIKE PROTEIN n=1 Tax=Salix viminalis TaxID=40686 RepID=A0A9Q0PA07_SALVM|nr:RETROTRANSPOSON UNCLASSIFIED-LIKE PROTEIN [Salix viminalis]